MKRLTNIESQSLILKKTRRVKKERSYISEIKIDNRKDKAEKDKDDFRKLQ
jgi:hypothetical protein